VISVTKVREGREGGEERDMGKQNFREETSGEKRISGYLALSGTKKAELDATLFQFNDSKGGEYSLRVEENFVLSSGGGGGLQKEGEFKVHPFPSARPSN